jgi:sulfhydrogenase subunit beta (sulfur reductase)
MTSRKLPVGSFVRIDKPELQAIVDKLREQGYRTVGPRVSDGAIVFGELDTIEQLPMGVLDEQDGGRYRLTATEEPTYFDYVVGPHSLKNLLVPARETVLQTTRLHGVWRMETPETRAQPLAVLGARGCDLQALRILDRVLLGDRYVDLAYQTRRENLFLVAVNCRRAAPTCFCHSMKSGPAVTSGFDLALTELPDYFVVEVGTDAGGTVITASNWSPCAMGQIEKARELPEQLRSRMAERASQARPDGDSPAPRGRYLETTEIHDLLLQNLEHEHWDQVAQRCLACGNCTMVCPTCFCSTVEDVSDLAGEHVRRDRSWDSCFTAEHSYMNTGTVRKSTRARYRQWLTHKLASWIDQFGTSGCTGCGRCITWCPVGIDLTEEVAAIRGGPT